MPRRANQFQEPRRLGQRAVGGRQDPGPQAEIVPHARPPAVGDVDPAAGAASATTGGTTSSWRRSSRPSREWPSRAAPAGAGMGRRRTAAGSGSSMSSLPTLVTCSMSATCLSTAAESRQPRRASGPAHGDHREIRLRPGSSAGHRDRVLIRRETAHDAADVATRSEMAAGTTSERLWVITGDLVVKPGAGCQIRRLRRLPTPDEGSSVTYA